LSGKLEGLRAFVVEYDCRIIFKFIENPDTKEKEGPKTIRALALVSELVYGARPSFRDPARFSFAHGGKDGYPYPVDRAVYDQTINILEKGIKKSQLSGSERLAALRRLQTFFDPP
ncbi:MAG TPA: DUF763 domain-containing protein, partial [Candidatus Hypogeohydataceae bacterium YC38]